jgi:putative flippase GtrA
MIHKIYGQFKEFIDYFLFGIGTVIINFGIFFSLNELVGLNYMIANFIAIAVAILFSYFVNKKYVFRSNPSSNWAAVREFALFVGLRAGAGVIDMGGLFLLVRMFRLGANVSKIIIECFIAMSNFLFSKFVIFRKEVE